MLRVLFGGKVPVWVLFLFCFWSFSQAGAQIAPGVTQSAAQTATITGTVIQSDGRPIADAAVHLDGLNTHIITVSDTRGAFVFASVPYGTYVISANAVNIGTASRPGIMVKGDINVVIRYELSSSGLKEIARVSTSGAGAQINVTPASISSIQPSDYAFQGNTQWRELLDRIPGVVVGGGLCGGGTTNANIPDAPFQPEILSINGALPYETSTTLDGMPVSALTFSGQPGNGVDLSILPMTAFESADVVRGPGANAPSILDSIGGSFVLHAPGQVKENQFQLSTSTDPYGGIVATARATVHVGRLSGTFTYGINNSPGPEGAKSALVSFLLTPATINGNVVSGGGLNAFSLNPNYQGVYQFGTTLLLGNYPENTSWIEHSGSAGLSYQFSPSISAQVFYAGHAASMSQATFFYPINFDPSSGYSGSVAPGLYSDLPYGDQPSFIAENSSFIEEKVTANIGAGVLRLSALQGSSVAYQNTPPSLPSGTYDVFGTVYYATAPSTPVPFNGTPESLTFPQYPYVCNGKNDVRDLLASYETQLASSSRIGLSYVKSYNGMSSYENNLGSISIQPLGINETTQEIRLYGERDFSSNFTLDLSYYFVDGTYHEPNPSNRATWVDSSFPYSAPRVGLVWRANDNVAIRAAAGGGFSIAPIYYLNGVSSISSCSTIANECLETVTNINLKPETSFGFDVGTDIRLHHETALSVDLYRSDLYGQIFSSVSYAGLNPTYGLPTYATEYLNLSHSRFEGINAEIHHDVLRGVYWSAGVGLTRGYVVSVPPGFYSTAGNTCNLTTGAGCTNTYIVPGVNFDGQFQSTVPYANGSAQIGYRWSPERYIDLQPTYFGNNNAYFRPAFFEFDAYAAYPLTRNITLLATARNITGIYDQNYEMSYGSLLGAPTIVGQPYGLTGLPYGPRTVIFTVNFKY